MLELSVLFDHQLVGEITLNKRLIFQISDVLFFRAKKHVFSLGSSFAAFAV